MDLFGVSRATVSCLAICTLWTSAVVNAQAPQPILVNPITNFCSRWWSQSVVKNDLLYIDSGIQKWYVRLQSGKDVNPSALGINSYMITIPLNYTWDWKSKDMIIEAQVKNVTSPRTGALPPSQYRGHMFQGPADKPEVYVYGGTTYMGDQSSNWVDNSAYPLWSYTYGPNYPWNQHATTPAWMPNHGAGAEAVDQGLAFYLNGQIDWGTSVKTRRITGEGSYIPLSGMVILDLNTQSSKNISTAGLRGGAPRVGGTMEYIPSIGYMGALVCLGGQIQPNLTGLTANVNDGSLIDFGTVDVFDIDSYLREPANNGSWYSQKTSGDIPQPRIDFCTVVVSAPDNSSHHIYLYGGTNPISGDGYDDVLILTLPSFTWTNVWPNGQSPRWGHNCHVAGKRQMISVGGNLTGNKGCDWELKGVAVWDMVASTWGSIFTYNWTDYQVPVKVLGVTGGTVNGKATIKTPATGWTDPGLKKVFETPRKGTEKNSTGNNPTGVNLTTPAPPKKNNTAVIAGGAVAGIAGLALIATATFLLRRRRQIKQAPHELPNNPSSAHTELGTGKLRSELQAVNENHPAELPGPEMRVEADAVTSTTRAELPGTNTAPGGVHGVPIVRTPGDDLPEPPVYVPGLNRGVLK
ncbi:hypothetical protein GQ44DRAFT_605739 [Phaeosphaeriaceae sp. PMI808]|nr:hypothetical protein GQ44DRAFT_605739 [Phaeosphaeriaceae sp. PMI808]